MYLAVSAGVDEEEKDGSQCLESMQSMQQTIALNSSKISIVRAPLDIMLMLIMIIFDWI